MEDPSQASEHSGPTNTTNMPSKSQESGQASPASTIVEGNKQQTETAGNEDGHDSSESDIDLNEPLDEKDWVEFESRYHQMVKDVNADEEALLAEFQSLLNFFEVWRQTSNSHEVDRTFKRLRTRMFHVQHSEEELEKKRLHYFQVVEAFKNALKLLQQ